MKKELIQKVEEYTNNSNFPYKIYFSKIASDGRYKGYKYFFKYHNTHIVANAFKTVKELEYFLDSNL